MATSGRSLRLTMLQRICLFNIIAEKPGKRSDSNHTILYSIRRLIKPSREDLGKYTKVYGDKMVIDEAAAENADVEEFDLNGDQVKRLKIFVNELDLPNAAMDWLDDIGDQLEAVVAQPKLVEAS